MILVAIEMKRAAFKAKIKLNDRKVESGNEKYIVMIHCQTHDGQ